MISAQEAKATDDQILQTRLLSKESVVIGPSINKMAAKLHDLLGSLESVEDAEVVKKHDAFVRELMLYRLEMEKLEDGFRTCHEELGEYNIIEQQMQHEIDSTHQRIESLKLELEQAKRIRKHKEECEAVARVVQRFPPRSETQRQLATANDEAQELQQRLGEVEAHVDLRGKQFRVLVQAVKDLQRTLEEDGEVKEAVELAEEAEHGDDEDDDKPEADKDDDRRSSRKDREEASQEVPMDQDAL